MRKKWKALGGRFLAFLLTATFFVAVQEIPASAQATVPANPVHNCTNNNTGNDKTDWSYIYFGSYPQTEVTGDALTAAITGASYDANGDAWVNGTKYRRISKNDVTNTKNFKNSEYHYFKWERIRWRVLQNNGSTLFVLADRGLDCKKFNEFLYTNGNTNTWDVSWIRKWLNDSFYRTAFSNKEQGAIVEQALQNPKNPYLGTNGGQDTRDLIYLLSIKDVMNKAYGFCEDFNVHSLSRTVQASDYAYVMGAFTKKADFSDEITACDWWLRSQTSYTSNVYVRTNGTTDPKFGAMGTDDTCSVVPAMHIQLSSDCWLLSDDGTSGDGGSSDVPDEPKNEEITVSSITISAPTKKVAAGKKITLKATVLPQNAANKNVAWESSNTKYATVTRGGTVTTKKAGAGKTVTLTVCAKDRGGAKASVKIRIMENAVTRISIKNAPKTLKAGKSVKLKAVVRTNGPKANKTVKWESLTKKYATVNSSGKVTAKAAGKGKSVTIKVSSTDGTKRLARVRIKIQ